MKDAVLGEPETAFSSQIKVRDGIRERLLLNKGSTENELGMCDAKTMFGNSKSLQIKGKKFKKAVDNSGEV